MTTLIWQFLHPDMSTEHLGLIPYFLDDADPRTAAEQIHANYEFGGWQPFDGWLYMKDDGTLRYPGDPVLRPLAKTKLRNEELFFYNHGWVGIRQPDGRFEVARLD